MSTGTMRTPSKKQGMLLLLSSLSLLTSSHATCGKRAIDGPTCDSTYTIDSGSVYQITCGQEYYGGDMGFFHVQTFAECIKSCDTLPGCVDVSYANDGGCWAKSAITTLVDAPHVWTAELIEKGAAVPARLDCNDGRSEGAGYTTGAGTVYQILCGQDLAGGDIHGAAKGVSFFEDCLSHCDEVAGCVAVAYANGQCYPKGQVSDEVHDRPHVWGAKVVAVAAGSTSSSSSPSSSSGVAESSPSSTVTDLESTVSSSSAVSSSFTSSDSSTPSSTPSSSAVSSSAKVAPPSTSSSSEDIASSTSSSDPSTVATSETSSTSTSEDTPSSTPPSSTDSTTTAQSDSSTSSEIPSSISSDSSSVSESSTAPSSSPSSSSPASSTTGSQSKDSTSSTSATETSTSTESSEPPSSVLPTPSTTITETSTNTESSEPPSSVSPTSSTATTDTATTSSALPTWWGGPLPSDYFTSTEWVAPPAPTGSDVPCLANTADSLDRQFHLLDFKQQGFLVDLGDHPGLPPLAESEEQGQAMLDAIEDWVPTLYQFESPAPEAGADDGLYDIVVVGAAVGPKRYLSLEQDGTIGFAAASSPSTTTVFFSGCNGRVRIRAPDGVLYTVHATGPGLAATAVLTEGEPANDGVTVLPPEYTINATALATGQGGSNSKRSLNRRQLSPTRQLHMDRCGTYAIGRGSYASRFNVAAKPDIGPPGVNGCGSKGSELVPDTMISANWTGCCNAHDTCFGTCHMPFGTCNDQFLDCLYGRCWASHNIFYPPHLLACRAVANLYYLVVSAFPGRNAFNTATQERCYCTCFNHWTDTGIRTCGVGALVECRMVRSEDVNNCGGCDWRCPAGYECYWGECQPLRS
ncbi:hypothetical protein N658DRAFT_296281 [Parathielavia hyrcaniae]|uniref:Apple domain-containing protein n=1 Tax=Parathielavia hyrcaniae TaxID=113614 RepID=A0AAN6PT34_9PEZI|nr:hypothetical protein N658DRAFT_296281 [Parathielavia hyrcaniae]